MPLTVILAAGVELNGGGGAMLKWMLGALVALRVGHAVGLTWNLVVLRAGGYWGTNLVQLGLAWWGARLGLKAW